MVRWQQQWLYFCRFDVNLLCYESETEMATDDAGTAALKCPTLPLFITLAEMEASLLKENDNISSVPPSSHGSAAPTSVCQDFPLLMKIAAGRVGLSLPPPLIPKPVSHPHKELQLGA